LITAISYAFNDPPNRKEYISEKWEFPGGKVEKGESLKGGLDQRDSGRVEHPYRC
jgi:8-oxo-dGTP pyrophosphatase MutT (NUDIX family)